MTPCDDMPQAHYVITAIFAGLNTLLLTFLINRRMAADKRERTNGEQKLTQRSIDQGHRDGTIRSRSDDREP